MRPEKLALQGCACQRRGPWSVVAIRIAGFGRPSTGFSIFSSLVVAIFIGLLIVGWGGAAETPGAVNISERFGLSGTEELLVFPQRLTGDEKLDRDRRQAPSDVGFTVCSLAAPMCVLYNGSVVEADVPPVGDVKRLLPTIMRALDVYPAGGLKNVGFRHVIFCVGLAENGEPLAGLAATYSGTIFLDARGCQVSPMHKVHHELFHLLVAKAGPDSQAWEALNPEGFRYRGGSLETFTLGLRQPGFVSCYAGSSREEDEAETFSHMMSFPGPTSALVSEDPIVRSKARAIRAALRRFDTRFDDAFWDRAKLVATSDSYLPPTEDHRDANLSRSLGTTTLDYTLEKLTAGRELAAYDRFVATHPQSAPGLVARAEARFRSADWRGALADYDASIRLDPKSAKAYCGRGSVYSQKGEIEMAIADYTEAIDCDPNDAVSYMARGSAYHCEANYQEAIADYGRALRLDPRNRACYLARALSRCWSGDHAGAIADYTEAIRLDPGDANGYFGRATVQFSASNYLKAITDCGEAVRRDPRHWAAYTVRGHAYREIGEYGKAISDFSEVILMRPGDPGALIGRGKAYRGTGDVKRAMADFDAVIQMTPSNAVGYSFRASAHNEKGEYESALADYTEAISLGKPRAPFLYLERGKVYERMGEEVKSEEDFARARTLGWKE